MAKTFLTNINLKGNQLLNAVIHSASSAPSALAAGQLYFNSGDSLFYYSTGTGTSHWEPVGVQYITSVGSNLSVTAGELNVNLSDYTPTSGLDSIITGYNYITASGQYIQSVGDNLSVDGTELKVSSNPTFNTVTANQDGAGENYLVGNDAWIGDVNIPDTMNVKGVENATSGYISFGNSNTFSSIKFRIGTDGSDLKLASNNDVVLLPTSGYAYIGTQLMDGSNRIATIGDLNADLYITSVSSPLSVDMSGNLTIDLSAYLTSTDASSTYLTQTDASSTYLSQTDASSTYLTQTNASSTYLTQTDASSEYLTQTDASSTYLTQTDASSEYLTQTNASSTYLTQTDASSEYLTQTDASSTYQTTSGLDTAISNLGYATQTYVGNQGFLTSADLSGYVTETGTENLSNKTFQGDVYFQSAGGAGGSLNTISVDNSTGHMAVASGYELELTSTNNINISSISGDIVINPSTGGAYIGSVSDGNKIAKISDIHASTAGLSVKNSVAAASTGANIPLTGTYTTSFKIDNYPLETGDRVLLKDQSDTTANGIYVVTITDASHYSLARAEDQLTPAEGDFTFVSDGDTWQKTGWIVNDINAGAVIWTQFSAAGEYTQGAGITISGNEISVDYTAVETQLVSDNFAKTSDIPSSSTIAGDITASSTYISDNTGIIDVNISALESQLVTDDFAKNADYSTVTRKFTGEITGNNADDTFTITHNLSTRDVIVRVYQTSGTPDTQWADVEVDFVRTNANVVTVSFAEAPATGTTYNCVVIG